MPKITEKMWRARLAELGAGKITTRDAAKMLGCSMRQVQRRCESAGIKPQDPAPPPPPPKVVQPAPSPASPQPSPDVAPKKPEGSDDWERAKAAIGGGNAPAGAGALPTQADVAVAPDKMATFCVDTMNMIKGMGITALADYHFKTDSDDPRIVAVKKLNVPAEAAVRSNTEKLYPWLYRLMQGWGPLGAWLAMDLMMSMRVVKGVAVEKGWKPKERTPREKPKREEGPEEPAPPAAAPVPTTSPPPPSVQPAAVMVPGI